MSETKAAFAERTIRPLENIPYCYMEDYGCKYFHRLPQFIKTLNSRKNCSIDVISKNIKNCHFFPFCTTNPYEDMEKLKIKNGNRVRISKYDSPFRKGCRPHFTPEVFETVAIPSKKPPKYAINDEQDEIIRGIFWRKE